MEQVNADDHHGLLGTSWEEFSSLVQDSLMVLLDNQPIPSPPPPHTARLELNAQPQPVPEPSQFGGYGPCRPGAYSQAQYLSCEWPVIGGPLPAAPALSHPAAAPPHTYNSVPVVRLPEGFDHSLQCVGMMNGEPVYTLPAAVFPLPFSLPAAPQPSTSNSNKRKAESEQEDDRPYVKRPPNAFMLYVKEHRPHVEEDIKKKGNGAVNRVLGQRWRSLSEEQQAIYLHQAERERELHALRYPGWSVRQNYTSTSQRTLEEPRSPQTVPVPSHTTPGNSHGAAATGTDSSESACRQRWSSPFSG
uniref:Transcription factor 7-like 1 n=1 Tax=Sparus aurata TaxID=8175 RepID=A0A671WP54_SPAAU